MGSNHLPKQISKPYSESMDGRVGERQRGDVRKDVDEVVLWTRFENSAAFKDADWDYKLENVFE